MAFIDDWVQEAFDTVFKPEAGKEKPAPDPHITGILSPLSQVLRSADASDIFHELTGQSGNTRAEREALMRTLAENPHQYDAALADPRLARYAKRTGALYLD